MVDQVEQKNEGEVAVGNFPLMQMPVDYQITIHVTNMINTYGKGIVDEYKEILYNPEEICYDRVIGDMLNYYGFDVVRAWFTLIYGWDFNKKAG